MLLVRFLLTLLTAVAAAVTAVVVESWWLVAIALMFLIAATASLVITIQHYTATPEWLGDTNEAELQNAGLVEHETGLPTRHRWHARQARGQAEEMAHHGVVAVPEGWSGPEGTHRVLLVTTEPLSLTQLEAAFDEHRVPDDLGVLVIVPTLVTTPAAYHLGDLSEAVTHAEQTALGVVDVLRDAGVHTSGHIGPVDPAVAVTDGLRIYDAEMVLVARHAQRPVRHLEAVPVAEAAQAFDVRMLELDLDAPTEGWHA